MSLRLTRWLTPWAAIAALACTTGVACGQDDPNHPAEFTPSNAELDRDLDQALEEEYSEPAPAPPPPVVHQRDRGIELKLGGLASYYYTALAHVTLAYREGTSGGQDIDLAGKRGSEDDFEIDPVGAGNYRAWFDVGRWISLQGGFRAARFDDSHRLTTSGEGPRPFTFGPTSFQSGDVVRSVIDVLTADLDVGVRPVHCKQFTLDLLVGARYVLWDTAFTRLGGGPYAKAQSRVEALLPMIGLGLAVRPIDELELYVRGRIGHMEFEREPRDGNDHHGHHHDPVERLEKDATSGELDAGIKLIFGDTFGFVVGSRFDYIDITREVDQRTESVKGLAYGVYAGVILQF